MKSLIFIPLLLLTACGKPNSSSCNVNSSVVFNNQTIQQVNGMCNISTSPITLPNNLIAQNATICGTVAGVLYNSKLYNPLIPDPTTPTGYSVESDNYYVLSQSPNVQCWYKLSNGGYIDTTASPPVF